MKSKPKPHMNGYPDDSGMIGVVLGKMVKVCQDLAQKFPELDGDQPPRYAAELLERLQTIRGEAGDALAVLDVLDASIKAKAAASKG